MKNFLFPLLLALTLAPHAEGAKTVKKQRKPQSVEPHVAQGIGDLFEKLVIDRHGPTAGGVKRAVFLKPHACARGTFTVEPNLPARYRVGIFAKSEPLPVWIRMSSDTIPSTPDQNKSTIGFAIKVTGIARKEAHFGKMEYVTQDFLTQNHHVFFVDTAKDFLEFTQAALSGGFNDYLITHPRFGQILNDMDKTTLNVLNTTFHSTTPYRFGPKAFAKYKVKPCEPLAEEPAPDSKLPNYLRTRLAADLKKDKACFEFQVQIRKRNMPLDRASVEWSEAESQPITLARIQLGVQDISANQESCENFSFAPGHALEEHKPVGSVNEARMIVYKRLSEMRRQRNQVPLSEPTQ